MSTAENIQAGKKLLKSHKRYHIHFDCIGQQMSDQYSDTPRTDKQLEWVISTHNKCLAHRGGPKIVSCTMFDTQTQTIVATAIAD